MTSRSRRDCWVLSGKGGIFVVFFGFVFSWLGKVIRKVVYFTTLIDVFKENINIYINKIIYI